MTDRPAPSRGPLVVIAAALVVLAVVAVFAAGMLTQASREAPASESEQAPAARVVPQPVDTAPAEPVAPADCGDVDVDPRWCQTVAPGAPSWPSQAP